MRERPLLAAGSAPAFVWEGRILKRIAWVPTLALILAPLLPSQARAQVAGMQPVPVYVNGSRLNSDALMVRRVARTLLPMRALFTTLGSSVAWDGETRTVYAWKPDGKGIRFKIDDHQANLMRMPETPGAKNWGTVTGTLSLDAPAQLIGTRVYIPLRAAGETLGADVKWDPAEPAVRVMAREGAGGEPKPEQKARALDLSLTVSKARVKPGEAVQFQLVVKNPSNKAVTIPFSSAQQFDFEVRLGDKDNDKLIWSWAHDRVFGQVVTNLTLKPGEKLTFQTRWSGKGNDGQTVKPGAYTVRGVLTSSEEALRLEEDRTLTVTP
jgi:flagellar hook assembly protein FlgD